MARSLGMGFCTSFSRIGGTIAPFIAQVTSPPPMVRSGVLLHHVPLRVLQVLMSRALVQALSPFALASVVCALGTFLLPIETKGRALLVSNLLWLPDACLQSQPEDHHLISAKLLRTTRDLGLGPGTGTWDRGLGPGTGTGELHLELI